MKTAVYVRVSTEKQSTESQEREISLFLESRGLKDVEIYKDEGESGISISRPQLNRLLDDCKQGKVETLIVWKLDRLFRSLIDLITHLKTFRELGITFISIKENIDLSTPAGRLLMHMMGAFGEFEREMIISRVNAGLANARAKGKILGRKPTISKELKSQAIELKKKGYTYKKISTQLNIKISTLQKICEKSKNSAQVI